MSYADREEKILSILYRKNVVRSSELARELYVSGSTLRRDLEKLEQKGLIVKEHGICRLSKKLKDERSAFDLRARQHDSAKNKIAKEAVKLIKNGMCIMMDGSSSAYSLVHLLGDFEDLLIITNSIKISYALGTMNIANISTGGKMGSKTLSFTGQETVRAIQNYNADILFFSCRGISEDGYLTDTFKEANDVRQAMMSRSDKVVALIDSSKMGQKNIYNLCHVSEVDEVICEAELPEYVTRHLRKD